MLSEDIKNALLNTRINHYLSPQEIDLLLKHADIQTFSEGEVIVKQGRKSKGIYIVIEGAVNVCSKLLGEGDVCLTRLHCGNYFGEVSIIAKQPCIASFIALEPVKCIFIDEIYFNNLNLFFPKIKYQITRAICDDMYSRYQMLYQNIIKIIENNQIKKQSFLTEVTRTLIKPKQIPIDSINLNLDQIRNNEMFESFTGRELLEFFKHWICLDAPKNCTIIHEGESHAGCFFVLQGAIQASIIHNNKVAKIAVLGPLKFFNSLSVIDPDSASPINFMSCEHAILLHLPEKNFKFFQENQLNLGYKFFDLICATFAALERATHELELRLRSEFYNR